ncbi:MAG: ABC transporter permease [Bdellovibrionota bacterium]
MNLSTIDLREALLKYWPALFAGLLTLALASGAVWAVGESPLAVLLILFNSAFGGVENFSYTLFYATFILLTATAVTVALEAGLYNIGAEGQLYIGALFAVLWNQAVAALFQQQAGLSPALSVLCLVGGTGAAFIGGAFFAALAGYLKTYRQTHEVLSTIMLNFIAYAIVNWAILNPLKNVETQNSETVWIIESLRIEKIWGQASPFLFVALIIAVIVLGAITRSWWGFRVRATGQSEPAAKLAGIGVKKTLLSAMALSGGIAGLAGFNEVYCNSYRLIDGFSPSYGFTGLTVALLARGKITGLIAGALLFAGLQKGALDLDLETEYITRDLSVVIQALVLVGLCIGQSLKRRA